MQDFTSSTHAQELWERFSYNPLTGKLYLRRTGNIVTGTLGVDNRNYKTCSILVKYNGHHTSRAYGRTVYIWVTGTIPKNGFHVDHVNHDTSDNRFFNLRCVTVRENNQNRRNHVSPGVYWNTRKQKWQAQIRHDGKRKYLGIYGTEHEALTAYINECDAYGYPVLPKVRQRLSHLTA